eukprot:415258-Prymnesium_polylepis.1
MRPASPADFSEGTAYVQSEAAVYFFPYRGVWRPRDQRLRDSSSSPALRLGSIRSQKPDWATSLPAPRQLSPPNWRAYPLDGDDARRLMERVKRTQVKRVRPSSAAAPHTGPTVIPKASPAYALPSPKAAASRRSKADRRLGAGLSLIHI